MSPFERLRGAHLTNHPVLEDLVFSVLSVLVIFVAITAIVAPATGSLVVTAMAAKPSTPVHVTFYGTLVDEAGQPIPNASVAIKNEDGVTMASDTTDAQGLWDVRFKDERNMPKTYTIEVTVYVNGQPVTGTTEITAYTGMKWGLQMLFSQESTWTFVPLPGY